MNYSEHEFDNNHQGILQNYWVRVVYEQQATFHRVLFTRVFDALLHQCKRLSFNVARTCSNIVGEKRFSLTLYHRHIQERVTFKIFLLKILVDI